MLENAGVVLSGLSRVEKAAFRCISPYTYFVKWPNTHRVICITSSWYLQLKPGIAQERGGRSQRSFARRKGCI